MGKMEVKLSLKMIWSYLIENPEDYTVKLLELINKFSKATEYQIKN